VKDNKLRKRYEDITKMLEGVSMARVQEYYGLMLDLKTLEISLDEFSAWVRFIRLEGTIINNKNKPVNDSYSCPNCELPLEIFEVNSSNCTQVGDNYKSLFSCSDLFGCGYSRYSDESVKYWIELLSGISKGMAADRMIKKSTGCGGCGSK
jgi:hypothetical protein